MDDSTLNEPEIKTFLTERLDRARQESVPISRHRLAEELTKREKIKFKQAFDLVDNHCDEHSPHTPDYLGQEFLVPYIKLSALFFAVAAVIAVVFSAVKYKPADRQFWTGLAVALVFALLASWRYLAGLVREFGS